MHVESILSVYLSIHHRSFHGTSRPRSVETPEEKYLEEAALELAQDSGMGSLQVSMGGCPPWGGNMEHPNPWEIQNLHVLGGYNPHIGGFKTFIFSWIVGVQGI